MEKFTFNIIANGVWGPEGLSGGDNIFINFGKILKKMGHEVNVYTWEDGFELCQNHRLKNVNFHLWPVRKFKPLGFAGLYLIRTLKGCLQVLRMPRQLQHDDGKASIVYSASDFWPDSIPAFLMSRRLNAKWVAGFYLFAPDPLTSFKNFLFWLSQKPIFWLVSKYADLICVTSEPDVAPFIKTGRKIDDVFIVKGGIDYNHLKKFQKTEKKDFEAVFVGRFHPQKGVIELIDIWHEVVKKMPEAKLALIGVGSREEKMKQKIKEYHLEKSVYFLGPLIGDQKNKILKQSKIFLHPVVYDSGGMAPVEALALGLPAVSFDLPVLESYFHQGFLKAERGDIKDFAQKIIELLRDKDLYEKMSRQALKEAKTWDWQERVQNFLKKLKVVL